MILAKTRCAEGCLYVADIGHATIRNPARLSIAGSHLSRYYFHYGGYWKLPGFLIAVAAFLYFPGFAFFYPAAVETFAPRTLRMVGDDLVIGRHILPLAVSSQCPVQWLLGRACKSNRRQDPVLQHGHEERRRELRHMQAIAARIPAGKGGGTA